MTGLRKNDAPGLWIWLVLPLCMAVAAAHPAGAQQFDSGSDGSLGDLVIDADTAIPLPDDGILNYVNVTVQAGATLRFQRNTLNTPVYILAQGGVQIDGTISVNGSSGTMNPPVGGQGGPGGFDGGTPGILEVPPGDGHGPGAGRAGNNTDSRNEDSAGSGAYATRPDGGSARDGLSYGSPLLVPMLGGSGGGGTTGQPGVGGGGGGGAILIAANNSIVLSDSGRILARGGAQNTGGNTNGPNSGSGGAIRLIAPRVEGRGEINVFGGDFTVAAAGRAGNGRVRIDTIIRDGILFNFQPLSSVSIGSYMAAFPDTVPRLDIVEAAGRTIEEGAAEQVEVFLPFGSDPNRTITVQARDFTGLVPIQLVLTPDSGSAIIHEVTFDMSQGNPQQIAIPVEIPVNTLTAVEAWTK